MKHTFGFIKGKLKMLCVYVEKKTYLFLKCQSKDLKYVK